jgi:cation diffusion facilitator CzcD-associated flavoprotein CzcO
MNSFHKSPSSLNIAIIGAGWSGIQITSTLKELGVTSIKVYESMDGIGGTWSSELMYKDLHIHTPSWMASFSGFPYPGRPDKTVTLEERSERVEGNKLREYFSRYISHKSLSKYFHFNKLIISLHQTTSSDKTTREGYLTVYDKKTKQTTYEGPYDSIIYTGYSTYPTRVALKHEDDFINAGGKVYHSVDYNDSVFNSITSNPELKVLVVGAGKSSCDVNISLLSHHNTENVTWLYRRPYQFMRTERFFSGSSLPHRTSALRRWLDGLTVIFWWIFACLTPTLSWRVMRYLGYAWSYVNHGCVSDAESKGLKEWDYKTFHFGMLDVKQRYLLKNCIKQVVGNPVSYSVENGKKYVVLESGETIETDVIVWCTGYTSGISNISFYKNNELYDIDKTSCLYDHILPYDFPILASSTTYSTTAGPQRGIGTAEYVIYNTCVRKFVTEEKMKSSVRWLWADFTLNKSVLFKEGFYREWIRQLIDLVLRGLYPIEGLGVHFVQVLCAGNISKPETNYFPWRKFKGNEDGREIVVDEVSCGVEVFGEEFEKGKVE